MKSTSKVLNDYNAWLNRPWARARKKAIAQAEHLGLTHATIHTLWALPAYRDSYAKAARGMIALALKMERFTNRHVKATRNAA